MHHFIYPSQDTFITNRSGLDTKNFGIDELLQIGTDNTVTNILSNTKDYVYTDILFDGQGVTSFTGTFTGSFGGTVEFANGNISGNDLLFSASYFAGYVDGNPIETSGSISGSLVTGLITGSVIAPYVIGLFAGNFTNANACLTGTGSGVDTRNEENWTTSAAKIIDRSLLKFNITAISESIANGDIINPHFSLNLKVCNEYNLPIVYTVYAFPISQSWNMGDGYLSDGGSDKGCNWWYKDNNMGTAWYSPYNSLSHPAIDFIGDPLLAVEEFAYGGGTWYPTTYCSQNFQYKSADINMDVTPIVMSWINGTLPNEGFILLHSDELQSTGSGFTLKFFSRDTNTIYSPYLDVAWSDSTFTTGSIYSTGDTTVNVNSGISSSIQSGSTIFGGGGISGSFSGSTALVFSPNYITATDQIFDYTAAPDPSTNAVWYSNNGYHYDSWQSAWQLDPYHGGFLPNTDIVITTIPTYGSAPVLQFTGSFTGSFIGTTLDTFGMFTGSGEFSASYFLGLLDNNPVELSGSISASNIQGFVSSSISMQSMFGQFMGQLTASSIYLNGTGSGTYLDSTYSSFGGFTTGQGLTGNITGLPVFGSVQGLMSLSENLVTGPCGKSFSASYAKAIFTDGPYSGSVFTAYYVDYKFENAILTGSWTDVAFLGSIVNIPIPSGMDPHAYAYVSGPYINGTALGLYTVFSSDSASFNGQFINGNCIGSYLQVQLSGSVYTSSFSYTVSNTTSSVLTALDAGRPFSINIQNLQPAYKAGDIIKIGVFGRKKFPLKYFGRSTQQEQYLVPEYLPSSSFYAIKDNQTEEMVVNFDSYTRISCEYPAGNYFIVDTTGLQQERYYRILIRVQNETETYTVDTGKIFKITR